MLGLILLAVGVVGFGLGAYWDLKTTEFPDWLPYSMIVLALAIRGGFSLFLGDFSFIINSLIWGTIFLAFGLLLYHFKQWGDGDAWLLGALGFLLPDAAGFVPVIESVFPFPVIVLFNFFLISLLYLIAYSVVLGLKNPSVHRSFIKNLRVGIRLMAGIFFALLLSSLLMVFYFNATFGVPVWNFTGIMLIPFLSVLILTFLHYARAIEGDLFKRKIPVKKLRVGDVLISDKWRGLTDKEVLKFQKKGGYVWIKEGVRFAPVFIITIIVTLFFGSMAGILFIGT